MNIEALEKMASGSQKQASFLAGKLARIIYDKIKAKKNSSKEDALRRTNMNLEALEKVVEQSEKRAEINLPDWSTIKQKIQEAKDWYESRPAEQRALIGAGVGLGGGALLGKLMGHTGTGAVAGALAGAGTGAYWNHVRKAIDAVRASGAISTAMSAVKPVVEDATKKTKDRINAIAKKLGITDKNTGTQDSATAKALAGTGAVN